MPSAFAKDGIHLSHEGSWQLACAAFVELLRICGGEGEVEGSGAGGCTTSWRGGAWRGAWWSGLAACENREARTRAPCYHVHTTWLLNLEALQDMRLTVK